MKINDNFKTKKVDDRNLYFDPEWIKELNEWEGHLVVIGGPSGVGKTTIAEELNYPILHSVTTRERRESLENYEFWNDEQFEKVEKENGFITTVSYGGKHYGVTKEEWKRASAGQKVVVAVMSPFAYKLLKRKCPRVIGIFLTAPRKVVMDRIKARDGKVESRRKKSFDRNHKSKGFYHIVIQNIHSKKRVGLTLKCKLWAYRCCYKLAGKRLVSRFFPTSKEETKKIQFQANQSQELTNTESQAA